MHSRPLYQKRFDFLFPKSLEECNKELQESERYGRLKLCLGKVTIDAKQGYLLGKALSSAKQLTHFFLIYSKISTDALEVMLTDLKKTKTLYHLDLSHCGIRDSAVHSVCTFIRKNRTVCILNLDNNRIGEKGAKDIAHSLKFNRHLSVLTLANNKFDKSVVRDFLGALKINRILFTLDLGDIDSIRLTSALKNNELFRAVTFDTVLAKPTLCKTRFGICKVSVIGEHNCGKSMFIQGLLTNEPIDKKELRKGSVNTLASSAAGTENFPQMHIRNIRTSTRLGYWEEVGKHDNFLLEHGLRTTHLLLTKQMKQAEKKLKAEEEAQEEPTLKKKKSLTFLRKKSNPGSNESTSPKKSLASSLTLGRSKRKKSYSDDSTNTSESATDSDDLEEEPIKRLTMHTLASFRTLGTLRRTQPGKDAAQRQSSAFSASSAFEDSEIVALSRRDGAMSVGTATTSDSNSSGNPDKKQSMMQEVELKTNPKESKIKLSAVIIEDVDTDDESEGGLFNEINLKSYVREQSEKYELDLTEEYDDVAEGKPFKKIQEKYRNKLAKEAKIEEANRKTRGTLLQANAAKRKSGVDFDSNLRAFSVASRRQSAYSSISSDTEKRGTFGAKGRRKTRLVEQKAAEHMRRHFSEKIFMKVKNREEGLDLAIWEMSDNNKSDAMFTGLYNTFLSQEGYGPTIVCFDLTRLVPSANNKSLGRQALVYYLKLAKARGDAKILLVGTKLDRIKKLGKLSLINAEVKKALKEAKITRILVNSQSKLLYYPVDIVRNFGITELRKKIEKVCMKLEQVKRHLTLKDLAFLDYVVAKKYDEDNQLRSTIDFEEILFWSEALKLERVRVESLLKLFSRQGLILYFPNMRSLRTTICYRVETCLEAICSLFNVERLNRSYRKIYNNKGLEDESIVDHVNGYIRNFLITRPMVEHICAHIADPDFVVNFLQEKLLVCDWIYDPELFYKNVNVQNNIEPRHLDADVLILPTLLNDRTEINNFAKLKKKRLTDITDVNSSDEVLQGAEKYEIFFEAQDRTMFPSGFFASYVASFIGFLTHLKVVFDKMNNYDKNAKHGLQHTNIEIFNTTGAPTVKIIVNDNFGFYVRGSRTGIRIFIHPKMKAGAFASFTFAHGMVEKVNKDILGINWSFGIRVRVKGKFKSLRKLKENVSKLQDVFSEFVGTNTFKVGKGISGIENYLRESGRR